MIRILFWIALVALVIAAIRSKLRGMMPPPGQGAAPRQDRPAAREAETMIACAHCHVYFPESEAVKAGGREYCSPDHARLPPA
ncbi:PP0621 family protein [Massilia sp. CCM 9210]|uniref:PP0621 family protein n=1 Tax=Massilia scottii TaxID=3057166 RepID=UPI0027967DC7|nr:PP0621 family protein [Massilia sp. CCM 9210]MDQ1812593.1 PP0621 family protein [Massilia sp. CCM 9210]